MKLELHLEFMKNKLTFIDFSNSTDIELLKTLNFDISFIKYLKYAIIDETLKIMLIYKHANYVCYVEEIYNYPEFINYEIFFKY